MIHERSTVSLLADSEVDTEHITDLTFRSATLVKDPLDSEERIQRIRELMLQDLKNSTHHPAVVFFVGPTSAGKTTTIAKRASNLYLEQDKRVGLISADTYRVGGAEQLRVYAELMEAPFCVLHFNQRDLGDGVRDLEQYIHNNPGLDYVFVDTIAYYSKKEESWLNYFSRLYEAFKDYSREIELVLPATGKYRDLGHITDFISQKYDYRLIFTKLDEADTLGMIYSMHQRTGKPIDYVTFGPSVPDAIAPFDPEILIEKIVDAPIRQDDIMGMDAANDDESAAISSNLLYTAEVVLQRTLSPEDMKTLQYISGQLHFSDELIEYLLQWCYVRGNTDCKHIEAAALDWAYMDIATPRQANDYLKRTDPYINHFKPRDNRFDKYYQLN